MITIHFGYNTVSEILIAVQMVIIISPLIIVTFFISFGSLNRLLPQDTLPEMLSLLAPFAPAFSVALSFTSSSVFT